MHPPQSMQGNTNSITLFVNDTERHSSAYTTACTVLPIAIAICQLTESHCRVSANTASKAKPCVPCKLRLQAALMFRCPACSLLLPQPTAVDSMHTKLKHAGTQESAQKDML
jgi:hypothetical protein